MKNNIGSQIRELRKKKRLTLKQVSEKTNLSISFLSQVERSKSSVTLESLKKISETLGVNPSYFFPDHSNDAKSAIKRNILNDTDLTENHFIYKDLSGEFEQQSFTPILVTLKPGENYGSPFSHKGEEFLYVLEGILTVLIKDEEHQLNPKDCIHFDATMRHYWFNRTNAVVKFLCVSTNAY